MIVRRSFFAMAFVGIAGCFSLVSAPKNKDGGTGLLAVGADAPEFSARDETGSSFALSSLRGKAAVVFFYPKDGTPGCTKEACAFRDNFREYERRGAVLIGVSADSEASHDTFRKEHKLPFPLASDANGSISSAYGVKRMLGMTERITFVVNKQGKIVKVFPNVDPGVHAQEVLAALPGE